MLSIQNLERLYKILNITVSSYDYLTPKEEIKFLTSEDVAEIFGLPTICIDTIIYFRTRSQWSKKYLFPALVQAAFIKNFNWYIVINDLDEAFKNTNIKYY